MAFIVKKKIGGREYYYLRASKREKGKVRAITLGYLGKTREEAESKMREFLNKPRENKNMRVNITYFVHGTTTDNEKGLSTGQAHGDLSELGIKQSKELVKQIKGKKFDVIFTSDLKRAVDSTNLTFKNSGIKIIQDKRLRECNYGDLNQAEDGKVSYSEHINQKFPNGESLIDVETRIKSFLNCLHTNYSGKNVAIIAHKAPQLAIEVLLNKKSWKEAIETDWRKEGRWQPGWEYFINSKLGSKIMAKEEKKEKFTAEFCPRCKDTKMVQIKSGDVLVFECEKCKFKKTEKKLTPAASGEDNSKHFSLPRKSEDFQGPKNQAFLRKEKQNIPVKSLDNTGKKELTIDELASFCKRKGFVFKSSEIYGGMAGFWDLGPLGVELMNNIRKEFWRFFVQEKDSMTGIEASIISHPRVWKASGHVSNFSDVSVRCKKCKKCNKVDKAELDKAKCSFCGGELDKESAKDLNLMFKTQVGPVEEESMLAYLRPETAQGMFTDFKLVQETSRKQLPFGIVQIGRCFRNEIAPRDFLFRSREFHIGEFEFFIHPSETKCDLLDSEHLNVRLRLLDAETQEKGKENLKETTIKEMLAKKKLDEWHAYWLAEQLIWFKKMGLVGGIKVREHMKSELSHYSSATFDMDYEYPFGSREIAGNANRGAYDLNQHIKESGEKLDLFDEKTKTRVIPRVIEPTFGMERVFLALLCRAYSFDKTRENIVLKLPAFLAPVKAAIFPIVKVDEKIVKMAEDCYKELRKDFVVSYDESGSVGRRYSRNDETGTPFCITFDEESLKGKDCTIRDRDTTKQIRVKISDVQEVMEKLINSEIQFEKAGKLVETRKIV